MKFLIIMLFIILCQPVYASEKIEQTGDALQILVPSIAYISTFYMEDKEGRMQFYKSFATNLIVTYGLKFSIDKKRPNGGYQSFPSGHTAATFQGAGFIHKRYGIKAAILPYLASSFVGYSRIESEYHDITDVLAGAVIGIATSFYFTDDYSVTLTTNSISFSKKF